MPCDCDQYARIDLLVGTTLCQRCPMCGTMTVTSMEPPARPQVEPPAQRCPHLGRWGAVAFLAAVGAVGLIALLSTALHWVRS